MHTLCCPFFLPAAAGRISKMYIHACIFTHPSQRADCTSKSVYTCRHIFLVILCIHMPAYFFPILRAAFSQPAFVNKGYPVPFVSFASTPLPSVHIFASRICILFCTFSIFLLPIFCTSFSS